MKQNLIKNQESATVQSAKQNDQSAATSRENEKPADCAAQTGGELAAAPCSSGFGARIADSEKVINEAMFGDLGRNPEWIHTQSIEEREKGIKALNEIVWKLDAVTQNKSLEWKLRMASAQISKYLDTVMSQKDHCGLVPLFP